MATNTAGTVARQDPRQVSNTIKRTLLWNDPDIAAAPLGNQPNGSKLPQNSVITDVAVEIVTAFNAGTTNQISVGTNSASFNNIVATADVAANSAGVTKVSRGWGRLLTSGSDTGVYAVLTMSGTTATTGSAIITITYEGGWIS